jgi:DNA repair protein RadC
LDIPIGKATQIIACAELGRRFFQKSTDGPQTIRTAKDVYDYLYDMRSLPKEHLRGIYLNTHHRIIHDEVISIGTINGNLIHPREVFKPAIEHGAAAVILAHNHPSGVVTPSQADLDITNHIIEVGKIIGIPLVDHVVIGKDSFISIEAEY